MSKQGFAAMLLLFGVLTGALGAMPAAEAHYRNSHHRYYSRDYRRPLVDYKTGKIIKGGLIGAGIGAGTGILMDGNVGRNAVIGAGLGAGASPAL